MKTIIHTSTVSEYARWSKFASTNFEVILLTGTKVTTQKAITACLINSIPYQYKNYCGRGFYFIKDIGWREHTKTNSILYFANALYKQHTTDKFVNGAETLLFLNPLYLYGSIGRKDIPLEKLIGATIEIIKVSVKKVLRPKKDFQCLTYKWVVKDLPYDY